MQRRNLSSLIYILISAIIITSLNIALTFIMAIFISAPYTSFYYQNGGPDYDNSLNIIQGPRTEAYFRDQDYFYDLIYKYTEEYKENVFLTNNRYSLDYIGDSANLDKFIDKRNPDFPEGAKEMYIRGNSQLQELYTDGWILNAYSEQFPIAGTIDEDNKHTFIFTELTDTYFLSKLEEFDEFGGHPNMMVPNEYAYDLAMDIQAIQADEDSNLLDTYKFDWQLSGLGIHDTQEFIKQYFGTFENPSYIVLILSLLLGYLYFCIYYFQKLRYRLKVNTYYGLSKEMHNRNMFIQQLLVFILSVAITLFLTSLLPGFSIVTWQEVYVPIYILIIAILSLVFPALLIYRNNRWLKKSRGGS